MTKDEALKLALEALVEVKSWKSPTRWDGCFDKEITAIKKALSSCQCPECKVVLHASDCAVHNEPAYPKGECNCGAQPEQEPVAFENWHKANYIQNLEKYGDTYKNNHVRCRYQGWLGAQSFLPQRTWVGLTEAQCGVLWKTNMTPFEYYQAIEAKLKEKNT